MVFQIYPYMYLFFLSACISGFTAFYSWKRREVRSARTFSILMGLVTWWTFFEFFEVSSAEPDLQIIFLHLEYLAIPWISGFLIWFSLEFGGYNKYVTRNYLFGIFIIPSLIFFSFFTDAYLHLFYQDIAFVTIDSLTIMSVTPGIMFRVLNVTNIVAIVFCFFILFRVFLRYPAVFRPQMILTLGALLILSVGIAGYFLLQRPYPNFDYGSLVLGFTGILILTAIFRFNFLDLIHIPYHSIFENLDEGIIILDSKNRIIEINKKASQLLDIDPDTVRGQEFQTIGTILKKYIDTLTSNTHNSFRIDNTTDRGNLSLFIDMYPVFGSSSHLQTRMIIIRDITEITRTYQALEVAGEKLNLLNSITRHDILNQVAIISGYAELMDDCNIRDVHCNTRIERIRDASDSVKKLIQFTATYKDLGVSKPVWLNISEVVNKAWNTLHPPDSVSLQVETDIFVFADMLLEKVFFYLMDNSLRHGTTVSLIRISSYENDNNTILVYEDNGCGVQPEYKERIFSRGFGKNTGYGLFLVQEILLITSIQIRETGKYGEGVRFEMIIPKNGSKYVPDSYS